MDAFAEFDGSNGKVNTTDETFCGSCDDCLGTERGTGSCQDTYDEEVDVAYTRSSAGSRAQVSGLASYFGSPLHKELLTPRKVNTRAPLAKAPSFTRPSRTAFHQQMVVSLNGESVWTDQRAREEMPKTTLPCSIITEDWFSGVPEDEGGLDPYADAFHEYSTIRRPDTADWRVSLLARQLHEAECHDDIERIAYGTKKRYGLLLTARLYTAAKSVAWITPRQRMDDSATVAWLQRDEATYRVTWSERDEQQYVMGRLRWQVSSLAAKNRLTRRQAVVKLPAAKAAAQHAASLKNRWNFQHEIERAGATATKEVTGWCKAAFGGSFGIALQEIRASRVASQRQPFAAVKAGLI